MPIKSLSNSNSNSLTSTGVGSKGRYRSDFGFDNTVFDSATLNSNNVVDIGEAYQGGNVWDSTVIADYYDTNGNGGRKLVRLSNGTFFAFIKSGTSVWRTYTSTDNGATWTFFKGASVTGLSDIALASKGTYAYIIYNLSTTSIRFTCYDVSTGTQVQLEDIDISQTATSKVSIVTNEQGTELHACWSSKNSTYSYSFNIRYRKGTINADGSVTWGAVQQLTTYNNSSYPTGYGSPSIVINSKGLPVIIHTKNTSSNDISSLIYDGNAWTGYTVFSSASAYNQLSPSAVFIPKSINGLTNGRIWVAWHGFTSNVMNQGNIMISYSDDNGITWSARDIIATGNDSTGRSYTSPSVTGTKDNYLHIYYTGKFSSSDPNIITLMKYSDNNGWEEETLLAGNYASTLVDIGIEAYYPPFIYTDSAKVGFCGDWSTGGLMSGTVTKTVKPSDLQKWGDIQFSKTTPSGTSVICDILDLDGNVLKANISSLVELKDISTESIKLRFTLSRTTNTDQTPTLSDVSITWEGDDLLRDGTSGLNYKLVVNNGNLLLEEV